MPGWGSYRILSVLGWDRTIDLRFRKPALYPTELRARGGFGYTDPLVLPEGLEPSAPNLEGLCSIRLSYGSV